MNWISFHLPLSRAFFLACTPQLPAVVVDHSWLSLVLPISIHYYLLLRAYDNVDILLVFSSPSPVSFFHFRMEDKSVKKRERGTCWSAFILAWTGVERDTRQANLTHTHTQNARAAAMAFLCISFSLLLFIYFFESFLCRFLPSLFSFWFNKKGEKGGRARKTRSRWLLFEACLLKTVKSEREREKWKESKTTFIYTLDWVLVRLLSIFSKTSACFLFFFCQSWTRDLSLER